MSELYGPVHTVLELTWEVRREIILVLPEALWDHKLYYTKSEFFTYNDDGDLVSEVERDEKDEIIRQIEYTYDSDGYLAVETISYPNSGTTQKVHKYDQTGDQKVIQSKSEDLFKENHTVNFYNKNGLCEKVEEYNYRGELSGTKYYEYDDQENLVNIKTLNSSGKKIIEINNTFNSQNIRYKCVSNFWDPIIRGHQIKRITYFDEHQNETRKIYFNSEMGIERFNVYEYEYDKYSNWTSQKTIQNGYLILRRERTIEYFE